MESPRMKAMNEVEYRLGQVVPSDWTEQRRHVLASRILLELDKLYLRSNGETVHISMIPQAVMAILREAFDNSGTAILIATQVQKGPTT